MNEESSLFDLVLGYPQWQGSGRSANLLRGAKMTAKVCARFAPLTAVVPTSQTDGDAHDVLRWHAIFEQFRNAQALLARHGPTRLLTAGGDCAVDIAVIDHLYRLHPTLTVIWVDAHLDANTPATSPSGNFHGMPVSALFGEAPAPMQQRLRMPLDPRRFFYTGIREGDTGEWAFQRTRGLQRLESRQRIEGPVHIHFDLDALDPAVFPHVGYPEPHGLSVEAAVALVGRLAQESQLVGLTITEFAPIDDDAAREGAEVIARICEAARP